MEKRYQIFISSTFADLEEERKGVMEAIISLNCFPAGMEMFPATDTEQFEYIKTIIDESDYYVLIIAGRYGSTAEDGISYTEKEFEYARKKGIPILVFVKKDIDTIPVIKTDQDSEKKAKLTAFRKKVLEGRLANFWDNADELRYKLQNSLSREFKTHPRIGWIKGNTSADLALYGVIEKLREENASLENSYEKLSSQIEQKEKGEMEVIDFDRKVNAKFEMLLIPKNNSVSCVFQDRYSTSVKDILNNVGIKLLQPFNAYLLKGYLDDIINSPDKELLEAELDKAILKMMALNIIDTDGNGTMVLTDYGKRVMLSVVEF